MDPFAISVRDFNFQETILMAFVVAFGVAFLMWLWAGHYERRGGFGKK